MNMNDIRRRISIIKDTLSGDDEYQHRDEDELHIEFIKHIAAVGTSNQREMAMEILKIQDLPYERWCA